MRVHKQPPDKRRVHAEGRRAADRAIHQDPHCGPCHLFSAINHALWAEQVGIFRSLVGLPTVKKNLKRASELDPTFAGAAAHRTMAQVAKAVPRMLGGGEDKAILHLNNALRIAPEEPLNYEVMVDLKIKHKDVHGALHWARRGVAVPQPAPEYVESVDSVKYMQQIVKLLTHLLHVGRVQ